MITIIGWCKQCGHDRVAGQGCVACGSDTRPFIVPAHELATGIIELPFGICASGLDTPEGRLLFLSDEGQAALQDAYREVLGDVLH